MRMTKIGRVDRNEVAFPFAGKTIHLHKGYFESLKIIDKLGIKWGEILYKWVFESTFFFIYLFSYRLNKVS